MTRTDQARALELYRFMRLARRLDETEADLARRGEATFHLFAAGHEGTVALCPHLTEADWLHCHYRDKALLLARGISLENYLHALMATARSDSRGRRMPPFVCDPALHVLSMPTFVGNNALQAAGVAAAVKDRPERPVVYCTTGDGGSQEGEVLEAIAEAVRATLPLLLVVQDNHYALSTPTAGRTFYSRPDGEAEAFYGCPIRRVDGSDVLAASAAFAEEVAAMREDRKPRIVVLDVERLESHSNSDDHTVYRDAESLRRAAAERDPIAILRRRLADGGVSDAQFAAIDAALQRELDAAIEAARGAPAPELGSVSLPLPKKLTRVADEYRGTGEAPRTTMLEALRGTLRGQLAADPRVSLYGQDIADPKGDVFGVTRGLSTDWPDRVRNAPLSEATILGVSIGRALAGERPVAFLQFADFYPVAYNQIAAELAMMYWRTDGAWQCPVIVMAVTGGYRPGLGPCHAQSPEAVLSRIPGLDVFMPSTAADAAGLLNAAFASARPTVFLYPKNLLNERSVATSGDVGRQWVPIGRARVVRAGRDLTMVGWGNTVALCEEAAEALEAVSVQAEVIDLRSLSPWDREAVLSSAGRTGRLLVVHEDIATCGLGAELIATVAEQDGSSVRSARVTTPDTYLPFEFKGEMALLPSFERILEAAAGLLELDLAWEEPEEEEPGLVIVKAVGSSPSDENVTVVEWHAVEGDTVEEGAILASVEAEKAAFEISSPVHGVLEALLVPRGEEVRVGIPVARIRTDEASARRVRPPVVHAIPRLSRRRAAKPATVAVPARAPAGRTEVTLSGICSVLGSREMHNDQFLHHFPDWNTDDVMQRTGIQRRFWIGEHENVLTLAVKAVRDLLDRERLAISEIDVLICSTGTPLSMTPSLACRILKELSPARGEVMVQAYDVNAACSGYLQALQSAYDFLTNRPDARVLVVTAETLSPVLNHEDPGTLFLFGDAATASLLSRDPGRHGTPVRVHRPVLSAKGESEKVLYVPFPGSDRYVEMEGLQVFRVAVRKMVEMLENACAEAGVGVHELAMIVPHQANTRIIESIRQKIKVPRARMFDHIRDFGNTSSNTIPLALQTVLPGRATGDRVGLCAFGGGFTFGATILDVC